MAQSLGMAHIGPFLYTGLRFALGSLVILPLVLLSVNADYRIAFGDLLQLAGAACGAIHVLLVGILATRHDPIRVSFIQFGAIYR